MQPNVASKAVIPNRWVAAQYRAVGHLVTGRTERKNYNNN